MPGNEEEAAERSMLLERASLSLSWLRKSSRDHDLLLDLHELPTEVVLDDLRGWAVERNACRVENAKDRVLEVVVITEVANAHTKLDQLGETDGASVSPEAIV